MQLLDASKDAGAQVPQQSLEAAYRYLLKSFDISETIYGPFHPMVRRYPIYYVVCVNHKLSCIEYFDRLTLNYVRLALLAWRSHLCRI